MEAPVYLLCTHQEMPIGHQLFGVKLAELPQCPSPLTLHAGMSFICWSRMRNASRKSPGTSHVFQPYEQDLVRPPGRMRNSRGQG